MNTQAALRAVIRRMIVEATRKSSGLRGVTPDNPKERDDDYARFVDLAGRVMTNLDEAGLDPKSLRHFKGTRTFYVKEVVNGQTIYVMEFEDDWGMSEIKPFEDDITWKVSIETSGDPGPVVGDTFGETVMRGASEATLAVGDRQTMS